MTVNYKILQVILRTGSLSSKAAVTYTTDGENWLVLLLYEKISAQW